MEPQNALFVDISWLLTVFLLSIRLAAVFLMTPVMYVFSMPATVRVFLVIALAVALTIGFPDIRVSAALGAGELLQAALTEMILGTTLALGLMLGFAAFSVGGALLDVQIGYGIAQVFDPVSRRQLPILTSAFNQLAVVVFFALNGHHALLRGFAYSLERFPPGRTWSLANAAGPIFKQVAAMFSLGFALVAPVVFCIFLVELGLGVLARNLPQMNMFAMGIPVKIVVGLTALSLWMTGAGSVTSRIYASIFQTWSDIFGGTQ
ncbi:flagellar biosynthetic protein FliR [Collimonas sp.]|jgi:flagellar biosynthetic protein FliR|uniref:flagellar biosynthetic protein FliR n=1 Tax=Collimonas sp. TaxID=1963772 RepID=UPI002B854459|nr:flagellar biosynthetic protein FliR [Collimonas sp.]HWW08309.1 flagellar biosynthetic protein FliR [Collimonas sp.]